MNRPVLGYKVSRMLDHNANLSRDAKCPDLDFSTKPIYIYNLYIHTHPVERAIAASLSLHQVKVLPTELWGKISVDYPAQGSPYNTPPLLFYIDWVGVGWQRHCKTCRSLRDLDNRGTVISFSIWAVAHSWSSS